MSVRISIPGQTLIVNIGDKTYTITFNEDDGIFIQSDTPLEVKSESKTGNWLYVK